jgi:hypothetical protein
VEFVYITFAIFAVPTLFCMLTWVVVTVYRLYSPERPLPFELDPVFIRERAAAAGESLPVGAREIREDQRRYLGRQARTPYHYYAAFGSEGLPPAWKEDLWLRRN